MSARIRGARAHTRSYTGLRGSKKKEDGLYSTSANYANRNNTSDITANFGGFGMMPLENQAVKPKLIKQYGNLPVPVVS